MNRFSLSLIVLLVASTVSAADVSHRQMQQIAARQLSDIGITADPECLAATEAYAVYGSRTGGFVVMGKYADEPRVLGYSASVYAADRMPCGLRWWLGAVERSVDASSPAPAAAKYTAVANFVKTQWGQGVPYNQKCPKQGSTRTPTGCIATAMAQVMRYYEWPSQGQGMGSYTIGDATDQPVYEAVDGIYDWGNMPIVPYSFSTRLVIRNAVSTLMYDCGKASKMNYNTEGSGAQDWDQALALARNFQYDSLSMRRCERFLFSEAEWLRLISSELQARRPVLYTGSSEADGGHAFLLSGMDASGRVYVNWGWEGYCDGYYAIDALKPAESGHVDSDFTEEQSMTIGIQPLGSEGSAGEYRSEWVAYFVGDAMVSRNRRQLQIPYYYFYNVHFLPFQGVVGLLIESTDGKGVSQLVPIDDMQGETANCYDAYSNVDYSGKTPSANPSTIPLMGFPAGYYRATWVSKAVQDAEPRLIVDEEGHNLAPFYFSKDASGLFAVSSEPITAGVSSSVELRSSDSVRYYDLQGRPVDDRHHGLTIVRQGYQSRIRLQ
jgi:hypothetical protein